MSHFQGGYDGQKHVSTVLLLFTVFLRCKLTGSLFEAPVHTAGLKPGALSRGSHGNTTTVHFLVLQL